VLAAIIVLVVIVGIVVLFGLFLVGIYNTLIRSRVRVNEGLVGHRRAAQAASQPDPQPG